MSNNGKKFETNFKLSVIEQGLFFERFQDSNKFGFGDKTRFTLNSPCDCFVYDTQYLYYIELKTTIGTSISFNQPCTEKGNGTYMIKPKQVTSLLERDKYKNVYGLLVLDYADRVNKKGEIIEGGTYAIRIEDFYNWAESVDKKSINKDDAEKIGIKIDRKRKKVNYRYDVKSMLEKIRV